MTDEPSDFEYDFFVSRRGAVGEIAAEVARALEGVQIGPDATIAERDAAGGSVTVTPKAALGALSVVFDRLREIRPGLPGEAADRAALRSTRHSGYARRTRRSAGQL